MSTVWADNDQHCYCEWCEADGECACADCEGK